MNYTITSNESLEEFNKINIGELFIVDGIPFIKVPEIRGEYDDYEDFYNCVRLDNGTMWHCSDSQLVKQPKSCELKIEM